MFAIMMDGSTVFEGDWAALCSYIEAHGIPWGCDIVAI